MCKRCYFSYWVYSVSSFVQFPKAKQGGTAHSSDIHVSPNDTLMKQHYQLGRSIILTINTFHIFFKSYIEQYWASIAHSVKLLAMYCLILQRRRIVSSLPHFQCLSEIGMGVFPGVNQMVKVIILDIVSKVIIHFCLMQ